MVGPQETTVDTQNLGMLKELASQFLERLRIGIDLRGACLPVATFHGAIDGSPPHHVDALFFGAILLEELALYPPALLAKIGLSGLTLAMNLSFAGQTRKAVPDLGSNILYFDVGIGNHNDRYTKKVIHHELFHFLDHKYSKDGLYKDSFWESLNPAGFSYGLGGAHSQDVIILEGHTTHREWQGSSLPDSSGGTEAGRGFLNKYCRSGVEEDKAEVFAAMMLGFSTLVQDCEGDAVLEAKVAEMMKFISLIDPTATNDPAFWTQLEATSKTLRSTWTSSFPLPPTAGNGVALIDEDLVPPNEVENPKPPELPVDQVSCPFCFELQPETTFRAHLRLCGQADPGLLSLVLRALDS